MDIPFEAQLRSPGQRMCGAAALAMVYHSLGLRCAQADIWQHVAWPDRWGTRSARTFLLAKDAIARGLSATVLQAALPWELLTHGGGGERRIIVNHRLRHDSEAGHYSVVAAIGPDHVLLHDPLLGPRRELTRSQLLELWRPGSGTPEIAGHVLVAISRPTGQSLACAECGTGWPASIPCPACRRRVPVDHSAALGCADRHCGRRRWRRMFCPFCDESVWRLPHESEPQLQFRAQQRLRPMIVGQGPQ